MKSHICWILGFLVATTSLAQTFSLEDILSAPYCTDLTTSDDGTQLAWVVNEAGIRKVFRAKAPKFKPIQHFATPFDDGQVISNLHFDHAGKHLFFVKGSAPNRAGQVANPASLVDYPKQLLYQIDLDADTVHTVGTYSNYLISLDDQYILSVKGSSLLKKEIGNDETSLITMRGGFSSLTFSPSGNMIAFVSNRADHSFIGTYAFGEQSIRWISPSVHQDMLPQWSPDGSALAFIRTPGNRKGALTDITGGNPFSIMRFNLATESLTTLWSSPSDDGGFAQYYPNSPLRWTKTDKILFYSEHEGYMKIYDLDPSNKTISSTLDGECEIEHSAVNMSGTLLVLCTNCGDIDRRNIYTYDLRSEEVKQISDGEDIETDPVFLDDGIAFRKGGYNYPTAIVVRSDKTDRIIYPTSLSNSFPKSGLIRPEQVVFSAPDGTEIHGQLFVNGKAGSKPGLLFMHGGPIRQMLLGWHYSGYYANAYAMNQYLANQGYVVMSVNYRAGIGYGKAFRRADKQGPRGASEYQDIKAAGEYLQRLAYVNANRIGLWGGSYGGLLTAQGLARDSDLFRAGVDFHGVHDWSWRATDFSDGGFWGIGEDLMTQAFESSPAAEVDTWQSPVLMIHGDDDRNVMFGQTVDLMARLKDRGVHTEVLVLPDEVHGFYRYDSWLRSYKATAEFFDRFLK